MSLGRKAGVRPGDLVGAIANETGLVGREIGPIRISDAYSVVGVPEASVEHVIYDDAVDHDPRQAGPRPPLRRVS